MKPACRSSERGMTLLVSIVLVGVMIMLSFAYLHHASSRHSLLLRKRAELHAQYAAEEALARYAVPVLVSSSVLTLEQASQGEMPVTTPSDDSYRRDEDQLEDETIEFNYGYRDIKVTKNYLNPEVSSQAVYSTSIDGVVSYFDPFLEQNIEVVRKAYMDFQLQSFSNFMYFIDEELMPADDPNVGYPINFWWRDEIWGRVHSNGIINLNMLNGGPTFHGLVTTAQDEFNWMSGSPNYNIFQGGYQTNYPPNTDGQGIQYPPEGTEEYFRLNAGRMISTRDVLVDSLHDFREVATTLHMRGSHVLIEQWFYDLWIDENHDNVWDDGEDTLYYEDAYPRFGIIDLPPPVRGTFFLNSKLFLEGYLDGQVTFFSADTIWLTDDCYYEDVDFNGSSFSPEIPEGERGMPPIGSLNRLGIVSSKNVIIAFTAENGGYNGGAGTVVPCNQNAVLGDRAHILITAAIMAFEVVFEVDFWHNSCMYSPTENPYGLPGGHPCNTGMSDNRGNIYLWGSVVQQRRGLVHRSPIGPYGQRDIGYGKRYHYDENFFDFPPPNYPNTASGSGQVLFTTDRIMFKQDEWNKMRMDHDLPALE